MMNIAQIILNKALELLEKMYADDVRECREEWLEQPFEPDYAHRNDPLTALQFYLNELAAIRRAHTVSEMVSVSMMFGDAADIADFYADLVEHLERM